MTTTVFIGLYGLLVGYGIGVRLAARYWRAEAQRVAAEFMAKVEDLDQQIAAMQER